MLAVQRPSMGSSKLPKLEMPFGCIFATHRIQSLGKTADLRVDSFDDSGSNHPFPSPTAPAPGPSILDDNESRLLDNFFDGVSSDHFNYDLFNLEDGTNLGMGWENLPPTFMGTSSTYGQHSQAGSQNGFIGLDFGQINTQLISDSNINQSTPNEVLQAAALLQNVPSGRSPDIGEGELLRSRNIQFLSTTEPAGADTMPQPIAVLQPTFQPRPSGDCYTSESIHSDVVFDDQSSSLIRNRGVNESADIRWGSDAAFATSQVFNTPSRDNVSAAERYHFQAIQTALSIAHNPDSICLPPSTVRDSTMPHQRIKSAEQIYVEDDHSLVANKRRKIETQDDDDDDDEFTLPTTSKVISKKRKNGVGESGDSSVLEYEANHHKRRKSTAGAAGKPIRENLTEEQKRENHIKSEQKRRTLIREGFEDLNELVPGLQGGGFSKSAVLAQAADWLEELIKGNEILRAKILMMERTLSNGVQ